MIAEPEGGDGFTSDPSQDRVVPTTRELAEAGLLSDRQAEAFILRVIEGRSREDAADLMGIDQSTVDDHLGAARRKIDAAGETLELVDASGVRA